MFSINDSTRYQSRSKARPMCCVASSRSDSRPTSSDSDSRLLSCRINEHANKSTVNKTVLTYDEFPMKNGKRKRRTAMAELDARIAVAELARAALLRRDCPLFVGVLDG